MTYVVFLRGMFSLVPLQVAAAYLEWTALQAASTTRTKSALVRQTSAPHAAERPEDFGSATKSLALTASDNSGQRRLSRLPSEGGTSASSIRTCQLEPFTALDILVRAERLWKLVSHLWGC